MRDACGLTRRLHCAGKGSLPWGEKARSPFSGQLLKQKGAQN